MVDGRKLTPKEYRDYLRSKGTLVECKTVTDKGNFEWREGLKDLPETAFCTDDESGE